MISLYLLMPLQLIGAVLSLWTFNYLNKIYDADLLADVYVKFNFFLISNFVLIGVKEFFVSRGKIYSLSQGMFASLFAGICGTFVFYSVLFFNGLMYFSPNIYSIFNFIFVIVSFWIFCLAEIINHLMLSRGKQFYLLISRFVPLLLLNIFIFTDLKMNFGYFLIANLSSSLILILIVFIKYSYMFSKTCGSIESRYVEFFKSLFFFSFPFVISGVLNFAFLALERSLWFKYDPSIFMAYQAFLSLYAAFLSIIVFPVVNFIWGKMKNSNIDDIFHILFRFQILAIFAVVLFVGFGKLVLSLLFSSFTQWQIDVTFKLVMIFVFSSPFILQSQVIGRLSVRFGYSIFGIIVESLTYLVSIIALSILAVIDVWLGFASLIYYSVYAFLSLGFLVTNFNGTTWVVGRSVGIFTLLLSIFLVYFLYG